MSLFNIIGKDCEDLIMDYKYQLDVQEFKEKMKVRNKFKYVMHDIMLYRARMAIQQIYTLEYQWCMAWGEFLNDWENVLV